jgi:predicted dehydrogenase
MIEGSAQGKGGTLRYGMVGGGQGAFIGDVHRKAIALDGSAALAAGCFSRSHENTLATGRGLGLPDDRLYRSFDEMAEAEARRKDGIDFAVVVTPNASHFAACKAFLSRGIHVVCDKPLVFEVKEAEELRALAKAKDLLFCVTYTYTGYPAVKHAREMIARGDIGQVRFVNAEYPQEWLSTLLEKEGQKQAAWRADPAQTGKSNCVGDIGSHVENMVRYLTGLEITRLCARLDTFVQGRVLDDNASILVEYQGGAKGLYWSSQIAVGYDNGLRVRIFGSTGSIQWSQENPNYLTVARLGKPTEVLSRGRDGFYPHAQGYSRIPSGHPEGYFEAFANIYKTFAAALLRKKGGGAPAGGELDFPNVEDGLSGVRFIGKCVESSKKGAVWVEV